MSVVGSFVFLSTFCVPRSVHKGLDCFTSLSTLCIVCFILFLNFSFSSSIYAVKSHCDSNLHFPSDYYIEQFSRAYLPSLSFFAKVSVHIFVYLLLGRFSYY